MSCYRIVLAEKARTPVSVACELLGVSTSGFYEWASRAPSDRALSDAWLIEKIKAVHAENRGVYGSRRVTAELRLGEGVVVSRKRVQRLHARAGLSGLVARKRGRTTIRVPGVRVADDLVERRFRPDRAGRALGRRHHLPPHLGGLGLPRRRPGRLLAADRRLVDGRPHARRARRRRAADGPHRRRPGPGLVHHSDQGSQFVSLAFGQKARDAGIAVSMGSKGCAYDNAVAESFFATLKKELVHRRSWPTRRELISEVFEFVEGFYNTTRRHSTLGYLSPAQFETMTTIKINKQNG